MAILEEDYYGYKFDNDNDKSTVAIDRSMDSLKFRLDIHKATANLHLVAIDHMKKVFKLI